MLDTTGAACQGFARSRRGVLRQFGEIDLRDMFAPALPRAVTALGFAIICAGGFIALRTLLDMAWPGAGPYALCYPAVLVATLFSGAVSGWTTLALTVLYAWYVVLPFPNSFAFENPLDVPRTIINAGAGALVVLVTQAFRDSARAARIAREEKLAERELFLRELDHRVANNFATVAAVLRLQQSRVKDADTKTALGDVATRVSSIASAHRQLYATTGLTDVVDMSAYLPALCSALEKGILSASGIALSCQSENCALPRDRAITFGVIVNELVTNSAKHAFPEPHETARIEVSLTCKADQWRLEVRDNGVGMQESRGNGLGRTLLEGLAQQARATMQVESAPDAGTNYAFTLSPDVDSRA